MKSHPTKRVSTFFLKAVLIVIAAVVTAACAYLFPQMWIIGFRELAELRDLLYPALIGFYLTLLPFLFAILQAFKLLNYIDKNNAFSELSINALRKITYCAIAMSVLYAMAMPLVFVFCELDDAPGGIVMWAAIICAPLIVATFAAVLQKLVRNALDMKLENDLTV